MTKAQVARVLAEDDFDQLAKLISGPSDEAIERGAQAAYAVLLSGIPERIKQHLPALADESESLREYWRAIAKAVLESQ